MNPKNTYRVRCARIGYWGQETEVGMYYYRWYWQANLRSWYMHYFCFCACNTSLHNDMRGKVKPRKIVYKG